MENWDSHPSILSLVPLIPFLSICLILQLPYLIIISAPDIRTLQLLPSDLSGVLVTIATTVLRINQLSSNCAVSMQICLTHKQCQGDMTTLQQQRQFVSLLQLFFFSFISQTHTHAHTFSSSLM